MENIRSFHEQFWTLYYEPSCRAGCTSKRSSFAFVKNRTIRINQIPFTEAALIHIMAIVGQSNGIDLEIVNVPWSDTYRALENNRIDIAFHDEAIETAQRRLVPTQVSQHRPLLRTKEPLYNYKGYYVLERSGYQNDRRNRIAIIGNSEHGDVYKEYTVKRARKEAKDAKDAARKARQGVVVRTKEAAKRANMEAIKAIAREAVEVAEEARVKAVKAKKAAEEAEAKVEEAEAKEKEAQSARARAKAREETKSKEAEAKEKAREAEAAEKAAEKAAKKAKAVVEKAEKKGASKGEMQNMSPYPVDNVYECFNVLFKKSVDACIVGGRENEFAQKYLAGIIEADNEVYGEDLGVDKVYFWALKSTEEESGNPPRLLLSGI